MRKTIILLSLTLVSLTSICQKPVTKPTTPIVKQDTTQHYIISVLDLNEAYNYINTDIYKRGWNNTNLFDVLQLLLNYMESTGKKIKKP